MSKEEEEQLKIEIDHMTHYEMCRLWRFGGRKDLFDSTSPISAYFTNRLFVYFGGFTPEISKQLG
jgi:hypothetical protein